MLFSNVKGLTIPEGTVKQISQNGVILWRAYMESIVSGFAPLNLPSALPDPLIYLKQSGVCEQASTPTPTVPVDIVCNNGALKWMDDELPLGYTRLQYIHFDGASYFDSGIVPNTYDYEIETKVAFNNSASTPLCAWGYMGNQSSLPRWLLASYSSGYLLNANTTAAMGVAFNTVAHVFKGVVLEEDGVPKWQSYIDGEQRQNVAMTGTAAWEANTLPVFIGGRNNNGTAGNYSTSDLYYHKVTKDGVVIQHLIPCKNALDVLGFYDLVSGTFFINQGSGSFTAGPVDNTHLVVKAVGTPEVLSVGGKNLFDVATVGIEQGTISSLDGGNPSSASTYRVRTAGYVPVKPSTQYTLSAVIDGYTSGSSRGIFVLEYETDAVTGYTGDTSGWQPPNGYTFTTGATTNYIRIVFAKASTSSTTTVPSDISNVQLEYGSSATAFEPYREPQTASVENLFGVGDYKDEQDIISGLLTHKVGMQVFDGTESEWSYDSTYGRVIFRPLPNFSSTGTRDIQLACTHFVSKYNTEQISNLTVGDFYNGSSNGIVFHISQTSLEDWKSYLAAQYAAGTPVIVLYPLAEETTESVTAQPITPSAGDNVISVTAEVGNIPLEVKYKRT